MIGAYYSPSDYHSAVVVPCYNEVKRMNVNRYLAGLKDFSSQVVLVDDGSRDDTFEILKKLEKKVPDRFIAVKSPQNQGKGEAVRLGMNIAKDKGFKYIGFLDADLAVDFKEIPDFLRVFETVPEVHTVIGVRSQLAGHICNRSKMKFLAQSVIAKMGNRLFSPLTTDTQCGAKMFKADVLKKVIDTKLSTRWLFDQELLTRLSRLRESINTNWLFELPVKSWLDANNGHRDFSDYFKCLKEYFKLIKRYGLKKI